MWSLSCTVPFPKVWAKFLAKNEFSKKLVEYHIREVTEERFEEAYRLMAEDYLLNEPVNSSMGNDFSKEDLIQTETISHNNKLKYISLILGILRDPKAVELFKDMCRDSMKQTVFLCCIDTSTNRIAGVNVLHVINKEDQFNDQLLKAVADSEIFKTIIDTLFLLYADFDVFDRYKVDKYIGSFGLSVAKAYMGRGIGRELLLVRYIHVSIGIRLSFRFFVAAIAHLLASHTIHICNAVYAVKFNGKLLIGKIFNSRKLMGNTYGIKITHTMFTSKYSNRIALNIGFKIDNQIS